MAADDFLGKILEQVESRGGPRKMSDAQYLERLREQITQLIWKMLDVSPKIERALLKQANEGSTLEEMSPLIEELNDLVSAKYPGLCDTVNLLIKKEALLSKKVEGQA